MEEKPTFEPWMAHPTMAALGSTPDGDWNTLAITPDGRAKVEQSVHDKLDRILAWIDAQEERDDN